jgi:proline dehydrogenase
MLPAVPRRVVHRVARRYIAGATREQAIALAGRLGDQGFTTTLDLLGEDTHDAAQARAAAGEYGALIRALRDAKVERNVSIKLTGLGLRLDPEAAFDNLRRVLEAAAEHDAFVRIDMEDASVTDLTLEHYRRAREHWPRVGTVLQARLRRTIDDARQLAAEGANLRLCKGIYPESGRIAHTDPAAINEAYLAAARLLLRGGYVGFATHDLPLVARIEAEIDAVGADPSGFEFQALLGVPIRSALERLRDGGRTVRLYLPYGSEWHAYSMRRLRENPAMAGAIVRSLFSRDRLDAGSG